MKRQTEAQGRYDSREGRVLAPRAWDSGSHLRAAAAGSSAHWPSESHCLPGCLRLPGAWQAAAAGIIPP